jgi:hypothetical protein
VCGRCLRLEKAEFEPFAPFRPHGSMRNAAPHFRDRVWPVFWRPRRKPRNLQTILRSRARSVCHAKWERSMHKAHRIEAARRWWCASPLHRQWDRVDDAMLDARRSPVVLSRIRA